VRAGAPRALGPRPPRRVLAFLLGMAACLPVPPVTTAGDAPARAGGRAVTAPADRPADAPAMERHAAAPSPRPAGAGAPSPLAPRSQGSPAAGGAAAPAGCPAPAEIVRRLQARYDTTAAFRADVRQETMVLALGEREVATGTVAFKKPGRMRWEFREPHRQLIISDGATLWIYQPAEKQVLKAAFQAAFVSTTPVSFLAGVGRISDDFRAEPADRPCTAERLFVDLVPKSEAQSLGKLVFAVERGTFDILEASVTDPVGNVTTLGFSNLQRNVAIPDDEFRFTVPAGVDIVTAPAAAPPL
jgi:outer membrane lipoprotein carrier protein